MQCWKAGRCLVGYIVVVQCGPRDGVSLFGFGLEVLLLLSGHAPEHWDVADHLCVSRNCLPACSQALHVYLLFSVDLLYLLCVSNPAGAAAAATGGNLGPHLDHT